MQGVTVSGLTTAASLWVVAAIGLAVGSGFSVGALLTTAIVLVSLEFLNRMEGILRRKKSLRIIRVTVVDEPGILAELTTVMAQKGASVRKVKIEERDEEEGEQLDITFTYSDQRKDASDRDYPIPFAASKESKKFEWSSSKNFPVTAEDSIRVNQRGKINRN